MITVNFTIVFLILLVLSIAIQSDYRIPASTKSKYKFKLKDNSIFRKIFKLKDKKYQPYNYFKIIPIFLFSIGLFLSIVLTIADLVLKFAISNIMNKAIVNIVCIAIMLGYLLFLFITIVWWEIEYKNEIKK